MEALANLILAAAVAVLFRPVLAWLWSVFSGEAFRLNLVLLAAVAALIVSRGASASSLSRHAAPRRAPLILLALSTGAYLVLSRVADVHIFAALFFGLAAYALLGLYVSPASWRRALVPALLLIAVLPFGEQANTHLGFSARLATARIVERALAALKIANISSDTILLFESGTAYVDVPCSGVKSLWTGLIFFLAATHVERRRPDLRWAAIGASLAVLLFFANAVRVTAIVLLVAGGHPRAAETLHEPLGMIGFIFACATAAILLRRGGRREAAPAEEASTAGSRALAPGLAAAFLGLAAVHTPYVAPPPASAHFAMPGILAAQPVALNDAEAGLFRRVGASSAEKYRFEWREKQIHGTALIVFSTTWRAHHPPEICLASSGVRVDSLESVVLAPERELRLASLDGGRRTAMYWYQSGARATGDLLQRIFAELRGGEQRWFLVSIMLAAPAGEDEVRAVFELFHGAVLGASDARGDEV